MVGGLRPLAEVPLDADPREVPGDRTADEGKVDPQAEPAVEVTLPVVPPGELLLARMQDLVGVAQVPGALDQPQPLPFLVGDVGGPDERLGVVDVEVRWGRR